MYVSILHTELLNRIFFYYLHRTKAKDEKRSDKILHTTIFDSSLNKTIYYLISLRVYVCVWTRQAAHIGRR
jgi:DNA replication protein DnaD